jgi:hypothetical protein
MRLRVRFKAQQAAYERRLRASQRPTTWRKGDREIQRRSSQRSGLAFRHLWPVRSRTVLRQRRSTAFFARP